MRASTSGPDGWMFEASTSASAAAARNCVSTSSSICSRMRCSMSARSSASVSNSLAARASSSSSGGSTFSFSSLSVTSTLSSAPVGELVLDLASSRPATCRRAPPRAPRRTRPAPSSIDVVALRLAAGADEVDDERCRPPGPACPRRARARRPRSGAPRSAGRRAPAGRRPPRAATSSPFQSATSTFGWTSTVAVKLKSSSACLGQLVVVLRPGDRPDCSSRRARSGTSPRCGSRPPPSRAAPCRSARRAPASAPCPCGTPGSSRSRRGRRLRARPRAGRRGGETSTRQANLVLGQLLDAGTATAAS